MAYIPCLEIMQHMMYLDKCKAQENEAPTAFISTSLHVSHSQIVDTSSKDMLDYFLRLQSLLKDNDLF